MKALLYCRYSSDNQREESIEAQIRACKEYCLKEGLDIVKIYIDEAQSAKTDDRENFKKMFDELSIYNPNFIVVHKLDRFARNRYDSAFYKKKLKDNNIRLISVLEKFDDSPESIILESVLEGMAEYYSLNLSREVKKGQKENVISGKHNGGMPPTGYDVVNQFYVINENEANIVRKIFELYMNGYGYMSISRELNSLGYKTKKGQSFTKNSIRGILINEKYTGLMVYSKGTENELKIEGVFPKIIEKEIFETVAKKMKNNPSKPRMNKTRYYLLTGFIECGVCGHSYTGSSCVGGRNKKRYPIYSCTRKQSKKDCNNKNIRQELIENQVIDKIKEEVFSDYAIDKITEKMEKLLVDKIGNNKNEIERVKKEISLNKNKIDKLYDLYLDDESDISKSSLKAKIKQYETELNKYTTILQEIEFKQNTSFDKEEIKCFLIRSKNNLNSADDKIKRKVIETFLDKVIIFQDKAEIHLKIMYKVGGGEALITLPMNFSINLQKGIIKAS